MSLEDALAANTAALKALTDVLGIRGVKAVTIGTADEKPTLLATEDKSEKKLPAKTETKQEDTSNTSEASSSESEPVSYDQVKKLILQISKADRNKAVALLARFGAKGGTELKPEQYAKFVNDAERAVSGEYDPEASDAG
jgi:hypothetical protein